MHCCCNARLANGPTPFHRLYHPNFTGWSIPIAQAGAPALHRLEHHSKQEGDSELSISTLLSLLLACGWHVTLPSFRFAEGLCCMSPQIEDKVNLRLLLARYLESQVMRTVINAVSDVRSVSEVQMWILGNQ